MDGEPWAPSTRPNRTRWATLLVYGPAAQQPGLLPRAWPTRRARPLARPVHLLPPIGINLKQLYGSTETAVFVRPQPDTRPAPTPWAPIRGVQIKVADNGEIMVKSAWLKGHHKNPAATASVLTADGWYHTSDAGFLTRTATSRSSTGAKDVGRIQGGPTMAP